MYSSVGRTLWARSVGAVIVVIYCFAGGHSRFPIWTDVAQSINMIIAIWLLFILALVEVGGLGGLVVETGSDRPATDQPEPARSALWFRALHLWLVRGGHRGRRAAAHYGPHDVDPFGAGHRQGAGYLSGLVPLLFSFACYGVAFCLPHPDTRCGCFRRGTWRCQRWPLPTCPECW